MSKSNNLLQKVTATNRQTRGGEIKKEIREVGPFGPLDGKISLHRKQKAQELESRALQTVYKDGWRQNNCVWRCAGNHVSCGR
jgi:hypothetical protein